MMRGKPGILFVYHLPANGDDNSGRVGKVIIRQSEKLFLLTILIIFSTLEVIFFINGIFGPYS